MTFQKIWGWLRLLISGVTGFKTAWAQLAAIMGMSSAALGWIAGIGVIIAGAVIAFDGLTTSVKEAQESLQEFKKATEELENAKGELESINDKIDEIQSKGPLSITDQAELQKLEIIYITNELL